MQCNWKYKFSYTDFKARNTSGHINLMFSLMGPSDPNFSKIHIEVLQKNQICFYKTLNIIQSCSDNKKEAL